MLNRLATHLLLACGGLGLLCTATGAIAQVNLAAGGTYQQVFDTLSNTGTSNAWADNSTLPGWYSARIGGSAAAGPTLVYIASNGSSNAGGIHSFGATGAGERALGSIGSGTPGNQCNAVRIINSGATAITQLDISYTGEQWRNGGNTSTQPLSVTYQIAAAATVFDIACTSNTNWTAIPELDFVSPTVGATAATLDGNLPANQQARAHSLPVSIAPGDQIWLRWTDLNDSGNDHGLSIDGLSITAGPIAPPLPEVTFAAGTVSATEGNTGDANPLNFVVNVSPAPQAGSPVTFEVAVTGTGGRFNYNGTAMFTVTDSTVLPLTISPTTVGNLVVDGNSDVTVTLSGFTGTAAGQVSPLAKIGTINDDDVAALPVVSFAAGDVSALEGGPGEANDLNFIVNVVPAPVAGSPVMFNIAAGGTLGRFTYTGPASLTVTDTTPLPLTLTAQTVGNSVDQTDASVTLNLSGFTGTDASQASPIEKVGVITDDDLPISEIFDLQGNGVCSPLVVPCNIAVETIGPVVRTSNNVITYVGGGGFFIQTPDARADASALTSNGLFVFASGVNVTDGDQPLAAGDVVEVIGEIVERFGYTQIRVSTARDGNNSIVRTATGSALPAPIALGNTPARGVTAEIPSRDPAALSCGASNFECFESMRVSMSNATVAVSNQRFSTDLYAEVYVSPFGERAQREKGARFGNTLQPENQAAGIWDGNPEIIEMDADFLIPANNGLELFGAARFSGEGVIGFDFGDYEFWPASLTVDASSNQLLRPVPVTTPEELTIGSFNAFRLCDATAGNTTVLCSSTAGAEIDTARVTHQLGQVSAYIRQVLRSPDVVGLQEVENLAVLTQLATQIAGDGGPIYSAHLSEGNDVGGIDVGYLINTSRVQVLSVTQRNANETWLDPEAGGAQAILHDRPPLQLLASFNGSGQPFVFVVINNHLRSRGGVDVSNADGERLRAKRFVQASSIAGIIQQVQATGPVPPPPLIVIGDMNSYQFTDAYVDSVGLLAGTYENAENTCAPSNGVTNCKLPFGINTVVPALVNAVDVLDFNDQYSYNFTESFGAVQGSAGREVATNQVLDHALFNQAAAPFVTGIAFGRGNVDSSRQRFRVCNYTLRDLTLCPQGPGNWVPTGSSDHDGLVIVLAPPRAEDIFANGFEP
ncbi:MAG: endonuclease/exonuclease/phosphatase family protein [Pseudomarimonas sp.]